MSLIDVAWTVVEASLRASVALVAVLVLRGFLAGRTTARVRRGMLLAAVAAVPLVPVAGAVLPGLEVWTSPIDGSLAGPLPGGIRGAGGGSDGIAFPTAALGVAALAWALGAAGMLVRLGVGLARASRRVREANPLRDPAWLAVRDAVVGDLEVRRAPELRVAADEIVPRVWGVRRPVVLLPASALGWSGDRRRAVLAHEIGHLARLEPLALIGIEAIRAVHWFDPMLRAVVSRVRRESELAADEAALGIGIDPSEYAGHLVALMRERLAPPACRAIPGFALESGIERRVKAILGTRRERRRGRVGVVAGATLAVVLLTSTPRGAPAPSLAGLYAERYDIPIELAEEILDASRGEGLDPDLAFGLVAEESRFDPDRVSPSGAVGLTQVLPGTAREIAPRIGSEELREVPVNLRVGLGYLREQIERQGAVEGGLLAYNLGPRRLADLRESGSPIPTDYPARILSHSD